MKIIFFGLGSVGLKHTKILNNSYSHELFAFRSSKNRLKNEFGIKEIYNWDDIEKIKPDIAFITNPTYKHIETAKKCAQQNMHLFIEKPLSHDKEGIELLKDLVNKKSLTTYIAYCLRFHPVIKWLKENVDSSKIIHVSIYSSSYLPSWRQNINHLENYSAHKEQGGGIILDHSHEIDCLFYLLGGQTEEIKVNSTKISNVTVDSEDFADILIKQNKIPCNIHLDFLSRMNRREFIFDMFDSSIVADLINNKITIMDEFGENKEILFNKNDMYESQMEYFLNHLDDPKMSNNIQEASIIFETIMKLKEMVKL